jgi:hypothetical protein
MAVTTTVQNILDGAYGKSLKNKPGSIATESSELLSVVIRAMQGLYAYAARINPTFFAESAAVAYSAPGWARPQTAEAIFRIENPSAVEVVVVPYDQRSAEPGMPAVYRFGQIFRPASASSPNPQSGNLTFFYAKRPTSPANLAATLDALWAEQFNELLMLEVALYLALKDGRADEMPRLATQRDQWLKLFTAFLEHETVNERRAYGHIIRFNSPTLVPLTALLAPSQAA